MPRKIARQARVSDILRAAVEVFGRKGFRQTQMDEIAREAGVAKGTLYNHFKNKAHLFCYVLENGAKEEDELVAPAETSIPESESDLLRLIREGLKEGVQFRSIRSFQDRKADRGRLATELAEIIDEWWGICEKNRIRIIVLEKSISEFPKLAEVFDQYARKELLNQLELYLASRMDAGVIRPLHSVPATARFILETIAWFGWKQFVVKSTPLHSKSEALPDVVSTLVRGLKK